MDKQDKASQHARHVAVVRVSAVGIFNFIKTSGPHVISCHGIPTDAIALRTSYDQYSGDVLLFYEHPSFPLSEPGQLVHEIRPQYITYYGDRAIEELIGKSSEQLEQLG